MTLHNRLLLTGSQTDCFSLAGRGYKCSCPHPPPASGTLPQLRCHCISVGKRTPEQNQHRAKRRFSVDGPAISVGSKYYLKYKLTICRWWEWQREVWTFRQLQLLPVRMATSEPGWSMQHEPRSLQSSLQLHTLAFFFSWQRKSWLVEHRSSTSFASARILPQSARTISSFSPAVQIRSVVK